MTVYIPLIISGIALCVSIVFGVVSTLDRRNALRNSREKEIYTWADETLRILPKLKAEKTRKEALEDLSIRIDVGRLLFPNTPTSYGLDKHPLNRGLRSAVLDPLVCIHETYKYGSAESLHTIYSKSQKDFIYQVSLHFPPVKTMTAPEGLLAILNNANGEKS